MADTCPCPAHRSGLVVTVTERGLPLLVCRKTPGCTLQLGHPGDCDD